MGRITNQISRTRCPIYQVYDKPTLSFHRNDVRFEEIRFRNVAMGFGDGPVVEMRSTTLRHFDARAQNEATLPQFFLKPVNLLAIHKR